MFHDHSDQPMHMAAETQELRYIIICQRDFGVSEHLFIDRGFDFTLEKGENGRTHRDA